MAADHRSAHPNLPGVPWWGAVLIAVALTVLGFAFDAGSGKKDLTTAFAVLYIIGCVVAVLAVRQSGVFTAVVQPPLVLFVAVPSAYYLFHSSEIHGIKDILINCGYPLIERFLLMFCTSVAVLLIGMARWYFGAANRVATPAAADADDGAVSAVKAKVSALFGGPTAEDDDAAAAAAAIAEPPLKHGIDRPATARRSSKDRPTKRTAATRSRHARPPVDDLDAPAEPRRARRPSHPRDYDPTAERPARRDGGRPSERSARDWQDGDSEARPRRRPRPPRDPDQRTPPPLDYRRDPRDSRELRDAREARDPRDRPEPRERPSRRPNRYEQSETYEAYEPPPRRRPAPGATPSAGGTHHPVSKVRYRGSDAEDGDNRVEYRTPPRRPRHSLDD
ncbi:hypothetical protein BH09ACT8_BH09ACT8_63510 [soil metagenome]